MPIQNDVEADWLAIIGKSLAMLVLHAEEQNNASLTKKADVLLGLGLTYRDAATMLGSSEASLRELRRVANKSKGKGRKAVNSASRRVRVTKKAKGRVNKRGKS